MTMKLIWAEAVTKKKLSRFAEIRGDMIDRGIASKKIDMRFLNKVVIKN